MENVTLNFAHLERKTIYPIIIIFRAKLKKKTEIK